MNSLKFYKEKRVLYKPLFKKISQEMLALRVRQRPKSDTKEKNEGKEIKERRGTTKRC